MPDLTLITKLAKIYATQTIQYPKLKAVTLAQWMLESGRGSSDLAKLHFNFGGLKWRPEMANFATKIMYQAHDGLDAYCKFATLEKFISGYWAFIGRSPYAGWQQHVATPEDYIRFIGPIYTPKPSYANDVLALVPEATTLLKPAAAPVVAPVALVDIGAVVIDPGHGGLKKDEGPGKGSWNNATSASGVLEKNLALDWCLRLRDILGAQAQAAGQKIKVVLTRTTDVNPKLADRAALAGANNASAFLCMHFNGGVAAASGTETFYAAASNGNQNEAEDIKFCKAIHAGMLAGLRAVKPDTKDRGVKPDTQTNPGALGVLRDTSLGNSGKPRKCLAAYLEVEFITNVAVDKAFISGPGAPANRDTLLAAIATAIRAEMVKRL